MSAPSLKVIPFVTTRSESPWQAPMRSAAQAPAMTVSVALLFLVLIVLMSIPADIVRSINYL